MLVLVRFCLCDLPYFFLFLFVIYASVNCSASFHVIWITDYLFDKLLQLSCLFRLFLYDSASFQLFGQLSYSTTWYLNRTTSLCIIERRLTSLKTEWPTYKQVSCNWFTYIHTQQVFVYWSWPHSICNMFNKQDWFTWYPPFIQFLLHKWCLIARLSQELHPAELCLGLYSGKKSWATNLHFFAWDDT